MKGNEAGNLYDFLEHRDGFVGKKRKNIVSPKVVTEHAASKENHDNGGDVMDQDKLLEKYIDTVDQDRREMEKRLTDDKRESEKRISEQIQQREERFNESMKSFQLDNKEREERFYQLVKDIRNNNNDFKDEMKNEMKLIREEINATKQDISNLTKHNESLATTNKWSNVATIIGISAIVVAIIIALITM